MDYTVPTYQQHLVNVVLEEFHNHDRCSDELFGLPDDLMASVMKTVLKNLESPHRERLAVDPRVPVRVLELVFKDLCGYIEWSSCRALLENPRLDPSVHNNKALHDAIWRDDMEMVQRLLRDERVNPSDPENLALATAMASSKLRMVHLLLDHPRVDPTAQAYAVVQYAGCRDIEFLEALLAHPRMDKTPGGSWAGAVWIAVDHGYVELVERLLREPCAAEARGDVDLLTTAIRRDDVEMTKCLLQNDPCANPTAALVKVKYFSNCRKALCRALADKRTDLTRVFQAAATCYQRSSVLAIFVHEVIARHLPVPRLVWKNEVDEDVGLPSKLEDELNWLVFAIRHVQEECKDDCDPHPPLVLLMLKSVLLEDMRLRQRNFDQTVRRMFPSE